MEHKSIKWLNTKWWYRLIKVAFCLFAAWALVIAPVLTWDENYSGPIQEYTVTCNYGNKSTFAAYKDKGIRIYSFNPLTGLDSLSSLTKNSLQHACGITIQELRVKLQAFENGTDNGVPQFELKKAEMIRGNVFETLLLSALAFLGVLLLLEISRRIFYYIVLGKIRPQKV